MTIGHHLVGAGGGEGGEGGGMNAVGGGSGGRGGGGGTGVGGGGAQEAATVPFSVGIQEKSAPVFEKEPETDEEVAETVAVEEAAPIESVCERLKE